MAIDNLGRVKVLSCRKFLTSGKIPTNYERETFLIAVDDTERILRDALLRMEKLEGVLDSVTSQKTKQIYGFLTAMRSWKAAGDFAFERATALLEAASNCTPLSVGCASIIANSIKLFMQHDRVRPMCEKILFTLLRNPESQPASRNIEPTSHVMWFTLELLQMMRAEDSGADHFMQATKLFRHHAICDRCNQVRLLLVPITPVLASYAILTLTVHHWHPSQVLTMPGLRCLHAMLWARRTL